VEAHFGEELRSAFAADRGVEPKASTAADAVAHEGTKNLIDLDGDRNEAEKRVEDNRLRERRLSKLHRPAIVADTPDNVWSEPATLCEIDARLGSD